MDNPRPEKVAVVDEVRERLSSSSAVLLTEYRGLKVSELAALRRSLRAAGGDYKIYKNTLVRFAVRDLELDGVEELLVGPTALAFVDGDAAAVAKTLRDFGRTNPNLVLKGGVLGTKALSADDARALADLPSREVLLARIAGGLAAPLQQFAGLLQALPRNLAYGLQALIDQRGGADATADAAPAATDGTTETEAPAEPASGDAAAAPAEGAAGEAAVETTETTETTASTDAPETAEEA
jgi:large subunit ribosomal protein L10